jgi:hypothetical protein
MWKAVKKSAPGAEPRSDRVWAVGLITFGVIVGSAVGTLHATGGQVGDPGALRSLCFEEWPPHAG